MTRIKTSFSKSSISLIALCLMPYSLSSAMRISTNSGASNPRSYADAYQQVALTQQIADYNNSTQGQKEAVDALPVRVANIDLARDIIAGTGHYSINVDTLSGCAAIYPNGKFAWDKPNSGLLMGAAEDKCVAEIEMRQINGNNDIVLARALVSAGDSIECNIGNFPESGYTEDAGKIIFPADKEPTVDDVRRTMNQEQKQNAALKTAAALVIGGAGGYLLNKDDQDKRIGSAAIGAGVAGGVTLASTQAGHVAGNTLMSAGVNAAAGGLIGNISGLGSSTLLVRDCEVGSTKKCLWGMMNSGKSVKDNNGTAYYNITTDRTIFCPNSTDSNADATKCRNETIIGFTIPKQEAGKPVSQWNSIAEWKSEAGGLNNQFLILNNSGCIKKDLTNSIKRGLTSCNPDEDQVYLLNAGLMSGKQYPAAYIDWDDKFFGTTLEDWRKKSDKNKSNLYLRNGSNVTGSIARGPETKDLELINFNPLTEDASDGALVDINNTARMKATVTGAGAGAALGGFSAYTGAQEEIENRWVAAVQEYKDSLQKVYCATGTRFLAPYNDIAIIPAIRQ